jgi:hypothetical protein
LPVEDLGIGELVGSLTGFDPEVAGRDELGLVLGDLNRVAGWVEHIRVRVARRLRELNEAGRSEAAGMVLMDEGRRSGREARATEERERVCSEFGGFEDALAAGEVSSDHLDVLSRLSRGLSGVERSDLCARSEELLVSATGEWVSEFERRAKGVVDEIRHAHRPQCDVEELERKRRESRVKRWTDRGSGIKMTLLSLDPVRDAVIHAAIDAQLARLRQDPANAEVSFAELQVEALVAAVSVDRPGRRVPEISVLIDAESLVNGRHAGTVCETVAGDPVPVAMVQRWCCEAVLTAVVVEADGTVARLGGEVRTANREQRRALAAMHRTCAHPHCTVRFEACRIHHVVWWSRGGRTVLVNLLPLCETHHHLVHEGGWTVTMTPERVCTWTRPDGTIWQTTPSIDRTRHRAARAAPGGAADQREPMLC